MNLKRNEEKLIVAFMIFSLICLLFFSPVAFGQAISLPIGYSAVTGTIYSNDGVTPLQVADTFNGSYIGLYNATTDNRTSYYTNDLMGLYSTGSVTPGNYYLKVFAKDALVGRSTVFALNENEIKTVDLQTSRMPTN